MEDNVSTQTAPKGKSAMGIAGFVIGLIALATSFLPIINNFSAFLAVIGFVFAAIGVVACVRGTKEGKGLSIAGLVICIVSVVIVLATQSLYSKAFDDATSGPSLSSTSQSDSSTASSEAESSQNR